MRRESDLPRRRFWSRLSGRAVLITIGLLFFLVVVFGRAIANFYADYLWHDAVGRNDIFWGQIGAKLTLFFLFFIVFLIIAGINLYLADRTAPVAFPANVHPYVERFHEVFGHRLRLVRYGTAVVLAFMVALPAVSQWQDWLLFRNSKSFGVDDEQFGVDVGFYVFELPFIAFTIDWLFATLIIVLILTVAAHLLNGGVLFTSSSPTVRAATKVHIAVLLAILAAVKAADYWLTRYELTNETRGFVQGATYTVVKAQLPALMLLVLIALLTSVLYLTTIRTDRWRLPLVASGLWLVVLIVGGLIYPAIVQSLIVRPNQGEREAPYIARNVEATRAAMGIGEVETIEVDFGRLSTSEVEQDITPLQDVRLLNPTEMKSRFEFDEGQVAGLQIDDLDVDRYVLGDDAEQVLISARELDADNIPNKSWQGRHLVSTRGCGVVLAPVGKVTTSDRPAYQEPELERPELYFSPAMSGYAIAATDVTESDCGDGAEYEGTTGVKMGSFGRRAALALAFLDYNIIGSGAIDSDSQMLWVRDVRDRVQKIAPFLSFDGDPYPVVVEGGVRWVIDGYTTTSRYPYAQRIGSVQLRNRGLSSSDNYIRNSVKATVDAYTGEVIFYVVDEEDPILRAWRSAFPDLFTAIDEMPDDVREHLRYPEDLFRVQTELYSKYQIDAEDFFERRGAWSVAQAPSVAPGEQASSGTSNFDPNAVATEFATESGVARFTPYYTMFRNTTTGENEFVLLRPFVPFSTNDARTQLQAYMTASSDPETYGRLTSHVLTAADLPDGPLRVADQAESEPDLSQRISRDDNEESNSRVRFGDLQLVPVADGLIWARPYYVSIANSDTSRSSTEYRFVIVSHNQDSAFAPTLEQALAQLFSGFEADIGDRVRDVDDDGDTSVDDSTGDEQPDDTDDTGTTDDADDTGDTGDTDDTGTSTGGDRPPLADDATLEELLIELDALWDEADRQLRNGDLAGYEETLDQARAVSDRALELIEGTG
ncbi:MAG: UPF0182 family protein [Ilumatobacter sp.]|uniref:UPF0182 family protein n=1 Tax=Ilumatobacter sp. TaxID=1967498 RepID=UPI00261726FF|nr:UPF0182 family protein [Ilumatobacter sp.]MDJ0768672.1 UPF0182 family protein [Ilumatobacter sp.]